MAAAAHLNKIDCIIIKITLVLVVHDDWSVHLGLLVIILSLMPTSRGSDAE